MELLGRIWDTHFLLKECCWSPAESSFWKQNQGRMLQSSESRGKSDNNQLGNRSLLSTSFQTGSMGQLNATWEVTRKSDELLQQKTALCLFLNNAGPLNPGMG